MHNGGNREKRYKLNKGIIMNNFKKNIFRTINEETTPLFRLYNILKGTLSCSGGFVNITGTTPLTIYTTELIRDWTVGTTLYSDEEMTIPIDATYIKSVVAGTEDLFFADMSPAGTISEIYPPNTPC